MLLLALCSVAGFAQIKKVAAMGSSTTAGQGASVADSSWVRRFSAYYKKQLGVLDTIYNMGVNGYTFYSGMPSSYTTGPTTPDPQRNVTRAVNLLKTLSNPAEGVIIVNYPSNNYNIYSIAEIMSGLQLIYDSATAFGNKCFITTTQPRTDGGFNTSAIKKKMADIKDSIINRFGLLHTLNFWDGMFNPADTTIKAIYSAGDNIHFNDAGHRVLFERVVAANIFSIPLPVVLAQFHAAQKEENVLINWEATCDNNNTRFSLQRSNDNNRFETIDEITAGSSANKQQFQYIDKDPLPGNSYYRLQIYDGIKTSFSGIAVIKRSTPALLIRKIYPVPASTIITLEIFAAGPQNITIEIINASGILSARYTRALHSKQNKFSLPVAGLAPGSYFARIITKSETFTQSFMK